MHLDTIETTRLAFPLARPITTNVLTFDRVDCITLSLHTQQGLTGKCVFRGLGFLPTADIIHKINEIASSLKSSHFFLSPANWRSFWHQYRPGKTRIEIFALAAIDIALWDLFAKAQQQSLADYLGYSNSIKVPAYGTTGWLSLSIDELIAECDKYRQLGIQGFKIRLGHTNDYERVLAVRQAMGNDYPLMLDANQQYTLPMALTIAHQMAKLDIQWFEEPIDGTSLQELIELNQRSPIPIAMGENVFDTAAFQHLCDHKAAAILQPDILRCGGISGFMDIATTIEPYRIPLCNHLLPELSASLIGTFANAYRLEYDDLLPTDIFTHPFTLSEGCISVPSIAGTGIELTQDAIQHYQVR